MADVESRGVYLDHRLKACLDGFVEGLGEPSLLDDWQRRWLVVHKRCHDIDCYFRCQTSSQGGRDIETYRGEPRWTRKVCDAR